MSLENVCVVSYPYIQKRDMKELIYVVPCIYRETNKVILIRGDMGILRSMSDNPAE